MISLLFDTSFWYDVLFVIAAVLIIIACIKWPNGKWFFGTVITLAILVTTGYCAAQLNFYYNAKGGIFGAITGIFETNVVEVDEMTFSLKNIELLKEHDDVYSAKVLSNEVMALEEGQKFAVYVNGEPCSTTTNESDYVVAEYTYRFMNQEFNEVCTDTLTLRIALYSNSTYLSVSTSGGADAVKYWNYYFNKNKFEMKIEKAAYLYDDGINFGDGDISNYYKVASYYLDNELYKSQVYIVNTPLQLLEEPSIAEGKTFMGWLDENDAEIENGTTVTQNMSLYGYSIKALEFEFDLNANQAHILGKYTGANPVVVIPSTYSLFKGVSVVGNDITITEIGWQAFNNETITDVTIPASIAAINETAFNGATNLSRLYVHSKTVYNLLSRENNPGGLFTTDNISFYISADIDDGSNAYLNAQYEKTTATVNGYTYNLYTIKTSMIGKWGYVVENLYNPLQPEYYAIVIKEDGTGIFINSDNTEYDIKFTTFSKTSGSFTLNSTSTNSLPCSYSFEYSEQTDSLTLVEKSIGSYTYTCYRINS